MINFFLDRARKKLIKKLEGIDISKLDQTTTQCISLMRRILLFKTLFKKHKAELLQIITILSKQKFLENAIKARLVYILTMGDKG